MDNRDQDARFAAESLLTSSSSSQQRVYTMNQQQRQGQYYPGGPGYYQQHSIDTGFSVNSPSIEYINEELLAGLRQNGQMSGVRRFFCLFLTFDLLFTFLMWLTCIMLIGKDIVKALEDQVVRYNVHHSMFDVVMAAACRFTVLLLFYALLYINHWSIIALSTSGTCAFLIYKVFVFDWVVAAQPVFQVLIILTSFVLAWGETWFLDFKVIPQETLAQRLILEPGMPNTMFRRSMMVTERSPLLGNFINSLPHPDNYTESLGNFYSPLDSPRGSDSGDDVSTFRSSHRGTRDHRIASQISPKEARLQQEARENLGNAWALINTKTGWKQEKETVEGDIVESRPVPKQRKIFRLSGRVEFPPRSLLDELFYKVEDMPAWNPTIIQSRRLQVLDEHTDIIYQVSAEGGGGVVTSREFVVLRHWAIKDGCYVSAGCSTLHPDAPEDKKLIRGLSGPSCWVLKPIPDHPDQCMLHWLLDTDLRGWVPQYMVEAALSGAMLEFLGSLRKFASKLREQGRLPQPVL